MQSNTTSNGGIEQSQVVMCDDPATNSLYTLLTSAAIGIVETESDNRPSAEGGGLRPNNMSYDSNEPNRLRHDPGSGRETRHTSRRELQFLFRQPRHPLHRRVLQGCPSYDGFGVIQDGFHGTHRNHDGASTHGHSRDSGLCIGHE